MAAAMAAQIFTEAGLAAEVSSAGVSAWGGQPASRHAVAVMEECGLGLHKHNSTLVTTALLNSATVVLTMTRSHRAMLLSDYPAAKDKIYTLAEYAGDSVDIADPFGGDQEEYRICATQLRKLLRIVADKLKG